MKGYVRVRVVNNVTGVIYEHNIKTDIHSSGDTLAYRGYIEVFKEIGRFVGYEIDFLRFGWYDEEFTLDDIEWGFIILPKGKKVTLKQIDRTFSVKYLALIRKGWKQIVNKEELKM